MKHHASSRERKALAGLQWMRRTATGNASVLAGGVSVFPFPQPATFMT
jgi:hypothetical protein